MVNTNSRIKNLDQDTKLLDVTKDSRPFILYFTASWCGPCRMISPLYEMLSSKYPHIDFLKLDIDVCEEISSEFNINSVPCFYVYKKKKEILDKCIGANIDKLESFIHKLDTTQEEKTETITKEDEEQIEQIIENENNVLYNSIGDLLNYNTFLPFDSTDDNIKDLIEDSPTNITIETEDSLKKFFETDNNTETYLDSLNDIKLSDINEINL